MSRLPIVNAKIMSQILIKQGYYLVRQKGSHCIYRNGEGKVVVLPVHAGETLARGLIRRILRDVGLSVTEYTRILNKS